MKKKWIINFIIMILCIVAVFINLFFDQYKVLGGGCILLMSIMAVGKDYNTK